uniref:Uncharacterized protein n=1 Tax=Aegilops tauschii TaxID=37682 RepID=M8C655_AEGTA
MEPRQPELEESCIAIVDEVLKPVEAPSVGERDPHIFPDPYAYFPMYRPGMSGGYLASDSFTSI